MVISIILELELNQKLQRTFFKRFAEIARGQSVIPMISLFQDQSTNSCGMTKTKENLSNSISNLISKCSECFTIVCVTTVINFTRKRWVRVVVLHLQRMGCCKF